MYYCPPKDRLFVYSTEAGHTSALEIRLTERDGWRTLSDCGSDAKLVSRDEMMAVLSNVESVRFRAQYFDSQQQFRIDNIRLEHVIPSDAPGMLYPEIEDCECPEGYIGTSCQVNHKHMHSCNQDIVDLLVLFRPL